MSRSIVAQDSILVFDRYCSSLVNLESWATSVLSSDGDVVVVVAPILGSRLLNRRSLTEKVVWICKLHKNPQNARNTIDKCPKVC